MYSNAPFEGGKKIETDNYTVCAVAISNDTSSSSSLQKAWTASRLAFGEPCVQFEHLGYQNATNGKSASLFLCTPLSEFIKELYSKKPFDGARIIQAPTKNICISVVTLEKSNYNTESMRDRVSQIKARQYVNAMINGSTISSDVLIKTETDANGNATAFSSEVLRERSMGFVSGMALLTSFSINPTQTTYIYFYEQE
jgi:hypothetical protein